MIGSDGATLNVGIDSRPAEQGARRVRRSLDDLVKGAGRLSSAFGRATSGLDTFRRGMDSATSSLDQMRNHLRALNPLMGTFAGLLTVNALRRFTTDTLRVADAIGVTAERVGVATESYQALRHAASQANTPLAILDTSLQRLTRRLGEAAQGGGVLLKTLERHGIAVRDANGQIRSTEDVLYDLADAMAGADSQAERLQIAFSAFDTEGARMQQALRGGSRALKQTMEEARRLGLVFDQELIDGTRKLNTELGNLNRVMETNVQQGLLRTLVGDSDDLRKIYTDSDFQQGLQAIGGALGFIGREALSTATSIGALLKVLEGDLTALSDVGLLGLSKRMLQDLGLLERGAKEAGEAAGEAGNQFTGLGNNLQNTGSSASTAVDQIEAVTVGLQRQIEQAQLMARAMEEGHGAVDRLNLELEIYQNLLRAGLIKETTSLAEAIKLSSSMADDAARSIGDLTHSWHHLQQRLEEIEMVQDLEQQIEHNELLLRYHGDTTGELEVQVELLGIRNRLSEQAARSAEPYLRVLQRQNQALKAANDNQKAIEDSIRQAAALTEFDEDQTEAFAEAMQQIFEGDAA